MDRRICVPGSHATPTTNYARTWREKWWPRRSAMFPPVPFPMRSRSEVAMSLLPIFLKLEGRRCLLVGAGTVALDKIASLLKTGLRLRVVAPWAQAEVRELARDGKLELVERAFDAADLDASYLVIAATDSPEVNAAVYKGAVERGILCNSVDDIPNCDFFFGSVVSRGELQIAIST